MPKRQNLIFIETKVGWSGHRVLGLDEQQYYKQKVVDENGNSKLTPGTGLNFNIPRSTETGSNENFQVFDINQNADSTMWMCAWAQMPEMGEVQIWEDIPTQKGRKGELGNQLTHIFDTAIQRPTGWALKGKESPYGAETDRGAWIHLPQMEVSFAYFNEENQPHVGTAVAQWVIMPFKHRALKPEESTRDAALMFECLADARRCIKWSPQKDAFDWENHKDLWGVNPVMWNGEEGMIGKKLLSDLAAPYYEQIGKKRVKT